jgi:hypothetical protein
VKLSTLKKKAVFSCKMLVGLPVYQNTQHNILNIALVIFTAMRTQILNSFSVH